MSLKQKWIEALRSGEYRQGTGRLNDGRGGFCCLGVLADMAGYEWEQRPGSPGEMQIKGVKYNDDAGVGCWGTLRDDWLPPDTQMQLARMNDDLRPFTEIALYIEHNIKGEDIHVPEAKVD